MSFLFNSVTNLNVTPITNSQPWRIQLVFVSTAKANMMPEPSSKKRNKEAEEDRLTKKYRDIGIKAVAAAVEPTNNSAETAKFDRTKPNKESDNE